MVDDRVPLFGRKMIYTDDWDDLTTEQQRHFLELAAAHEKRKVSTRDHVTNDSTLLFVHLAEMFEKSTDRLEDKVANMGQTITSTMEHCQAQREQNFAKRDKVMRYVVLALASLWIIVAGDLVFGPAVSARLLKILAGLFT